MDLTRQPYLIPIIGISMWLFLSAVFAFTSGWWSLAQYFPASERPDGERILGQVKQIGLIPENHVTHMIVSPSGLYLYESILFKFLHPALLIPWSEVHHVGTIKMLWWQTYQFDLASITSIRVTQTAYDAMVKYAT
jgi:sporulation protein YlmC with PRC-barrel domain